MQEKTSIKERESSSDAVWQHIELTEDQLKVQRRLKWKMDFWILSFVTVIYFCNSMDRGDIGYAKVAGMVQDLGFTPNQFSLIISIFYASYIVFQPAGTLLMKKLTPRYILGGSVIAWGFFTVMLMLVKNVAGAVVLRLLIGVAEAGLQAAPLYLALWYTRDEFATRTAVWYSVSSIGAVFSGLIAYALQSSDPSQKYRPWQLLFLCEGLFPILVGILTLIFLPPVPEKARRGFTEEEREVILIRTNNAMNTAGSEVTKKGIIDGLKDPHIYIVGFVYGLCLGSSTGFGNFLPSLLNGFGYTAIRAQLMSVPVNLISFCSAIFWSWFSDRHSFRGPLIAIMALLEGVGYIILLVVVDGIGVRFFACCLISFSSAPFVPLCIAFCLNNVCGHSQRAVGLAVLIMMGQVGGLVSGFLYNGPPRYILGVSSALGMTVTIVITVCVYDFVLWKRNKARRLFSDSDEAQELRLYTLEAIGNRHPDFYYTL